MINFDEKLRSNLQKKIVRRWKIALLERIERLYIIR